MILVYDMFGPDIPIPIDQYIRSKKFKKYYNRETCAAISAMGRLLEKVDLDTGKIPVYYATGLLEYEDYGLQYIVRDSVNGEGKFSEKLFVEQGLSRISPLNQFKVLQNMPLCFVSIEFGLKGDNAVIYASTAGLLFSALFSNASVSFIGAGKTHKNGAVEIGFAFIEKEELFEYANYLEHQGEAIDFFRELHAASV